MEKYAALWSVPVALHDIPETGLHLAIEAPAEARAAIAKLAALRDLPQLAAEFDLARRGSGVHVTGTVHARIGQTCVVSLEPMENVLDEPVDLLFTASGETAAASNATEEAPEAMIDGKVNLGALATEFLILGIEPYPRKQGVQFTAPQAKDEGERPFAALAALKDRGGSA